MRLGRSEQTQEAVRITVTVDVQIEQFTESDVEPLRKDILKALERMSAEIGWMSREKLIALALGVK